MDNDKGIESDKIWSRYLLLENSFLKFQYYIPFIPEHYNVTSPHLDDLLIRTCSLLESFFKTSSHCIIFDGEVEEIPLQKLRNEPKKAGIKDIEAVFNNRYNLSDKNIHFIFQEYQHTFSPFQGWCNKDSPIWWIDYNKLKHNGFKFSSSYQNVRNALGGLFLSIVIHLDMLHYLEGISIIDGIGIQKAFMDLYDACPDYDHIEVGFLQCIVARSKLFGFVYTIFPDIRNGTEKSIKRIFTPPFNLSIDIKGEREWTFNKRFNHGK
nr:hypothetical protein [uncultured Methanospirillum sp.]